MKWIACATLCLLACQPRRPSPPGEAATAAPGPLPPPAFACDAGRCVQQHPAMPDDGEWACADAAGATICVGGERPAGVAPGPGDPRWTCGTRRGARGDQLGGRVCRTTTPDFPDSRMAGWRCRTLHGPPARRACDRDPQAHTLADPCGAATPCVDGSRCLDGRCVPPAAPPDCWLDEDCLSRTGSEPPARRCRFGVCDQGGA